MNDRYRAAPLDWEAKKRTVATVAGLLAFLILILLLRQIVPVITLVAFPVILAPAIAYASTPLGYTLDEHLLTIDRKTLWSLRIPLAEITACHPLTRASLQGAVRVYGTGGLFGWAGRHKTAELGTFSMHATNLDRLILVRRRHRKPVVISPLDPAAFLTGLQRQYNTIVIPPRRDPRQIR